jgi:hypothetical protein
MADEHVVLPTGSTALKISAPYGGRGRILGHIHFEGTFASMWVNLISVLLSGSCVFTPRQSAGMRLASELPVKEINP